MTIGEEAAGAAWDIAAITPFVRGKVIVSSRQHLTFSRQTPMSRPPSSPSSSGSGESTPTQPKLARIAVLLESSRAFGRGVLEGLAECLQVRRHWMVYYQEGG